MGNESAFQLLNRMDHESEEEKDIDPFARQAYLEAQQALADKETEKYINLLSQSANLGYVQALNDWETSILMENWPLNIWAKHMNIF